MANDPSLRSTFAKNAAEFTSTHGFDGMDMDWEYPGQRDTPNKDEDKQAFSLLLAEMRQEFDKRKLLLSAAVAAVKSSASLSYDIPALSRLFSLSFIGSTVENGNSARDSITLWRKMLFFLSSPFLFLVRAMGHGRFAARVGVCDFIGLL